MCFIDYVLLKTARGVDVRKWDILTPMLDNEGEGILIPHYTASWPPCGVWVLVEGQCATVAAIQPLYDVFFLAKYDSVQ